MTKNMQNDLKWEQMTNNWKQHTGFSPVTEDFYTVVMIILLLLPDVGAGKYQMAQTWV